MWLWVAVVLQSVLYSQAEFGTAYLKNSRLCHSWSCINTKLGLPLSLPPRDQYEQLLRSILPDQWEKAVEKSLDACYEKRIRNYVNTCPGQALLQCTLDNLMENCPEGSLRKDDGCYPVSSLAGTKYMFTQSRYQNLEKNLPKEKRPAWFMRHYFSEKCCEVPKLVNSTVLEECGFTSFLVYNDHLPRTENFMDSPVFMKQAATPTHKPNFKLRIDPNSIHVPEKSPKVDGDKLRVIPLQLENKNDPLQCCDMEGFIKQSWRSECGFRLSWNGPDRLRVEDNTPTTAAPPPVINTPVIRDIKMVPLTCEKESCIFGKLGVISESGAVNIESFTKLLDNFTTVHPTWSKAKARVITTCLNKMTLGGYDAGCDINKVLACTLDVLSENCPYATKQDVCRHSRQNTTVCQISSSKYRPKNRRPICGLPNLVSGSVLSSCGVTSVSRLEYVTEQRRTVEPMWRNKYSCKDLSPSTLCLMKKMGVLNKYNFMDYFQMKDRIRQFSIRSPEWFGFVEVYMDVFAGMPLYTEYCNSAKKLLNVVDAMLMTCPISKRKNTAHCNKLFNDITNVPPIGEHQNITKEKLDQILKHFNHVYLPSSQLTITKPTVNKRVVLKKTAPTYDFGVLNRGNVPPVRVIPVKKSDETLVILPVYLRYRDDLLRTGNTGPYKDGVFKSTPFMLHGKINPTENIVATKSTTVEET